MLLGGIVGFLVFPRRIGCASAGQSSGPESAISVPFTVFLAFVIGFATLVVGSFFVGLTIMGICALQILDRGRDPAPEGTSRGVSTWLARSQ